MGKLSKLIGDEVKQILDMSDAARMQRAKDMGFDTDKVYYHGTSSDFDEFDPSMGGSNYGVEDDKGLVFFSNKKDEAEFSANEASSNIGGNPQVLETYLRLKNPMIVDSKGKNPTNYMDAKKEHLKYDLEFKENEDGELYDGIIVRNFDTGEEVVAVSDPSMIRKTTAAFDPEKKDSGNLLAGALPVGAIGAASMLSPNESYAQTVNNQATPGPDDVGSIKAPVHPRAAQMAGYFDKYNRAIEGTPLGLVLPEAPADWANKLAYDGKTRIKDRIIAALGML